MKRNVIEAMHNCLIKISRDIESGELSLSDLRNSPLRHSYFRGKRLQFIEYFSLSEDIFLKPKPEISIRSFDAYRDGTDAYIENKFGVYMPSNLWNFLFSSNWLDYDKSLIFYLTQLKIMYDHGEEMLNQIHYEFVRDPTSPKIEYGYLAHKKIMGMNVDISCYGKLQE